MKKSHASNTTASAVTNNTAASADTTASTASIASTTSTAPQAQHLAAPLPDDPLLREAYSRVEPEFGALTPEQLAIINVDVRRVVGTVLEALPRILALRERLAALPEFNLANLDHLRDYTLALWFADAVYALDDVPGENLLDLAAETTRTRDKLFIAAQAVAEFGLIASSKLATLRQSTAHAEIADDVIKLVLLFRAAWPDLAGRTLLTVADLDAADALAHRLADGVHRRDNATSVPSDAMRNRQRAYTLFRRAYNEVRRGVLYLCADSGDADTIAPSVFVRTARGPEPKPRTETPTTPTTPTTPAVHTALGPFTEPVEPIESAPAPGITQRPVPQDDPFARP